MPAIKRTVSTLALVLREGSALSVAHKLLDLELALRAKHSNHVEPLVLHRLLGTAGGVGVASPEPGELILVRAGNLLEVAPLQLLVSMRLLAHLLADEETTLMRGLMLEGAWCLIRLHSTRTSRPRSDARKVCSRRAPQRRTAFSLVNEARSCR